MHRCPRSVMGAIEAVYQKGRIHQDERTLLRPFPQTEPDKVKCAVIADGEQETS